VRHHLGGCIGDCHGISAINDNNNKTIDALMYISFKSTLVMFSLSMSRIHFHDEFFTVTAVKGCYHTWQNQIRNEVSRNMLFRAITRFAPTQYSVPSFHKKTVA
jgi:hypothetical protein